MHNQMKIGTKLAVVFALVLGLLVSVAGVAWYALKESKRSTDEMMEVMGGIESLAEQEDNTEDGKTATFPFLNRLFGGPDDTPPRDLPRQNRETKDKGTGGQAVPGAKKRKYLENYCISLTRKAAEGKLDRIIGRATETERVVQILNRRQKNNPCLIGEPGVGKTAIAEGLSQRIFDGDVPGKLRDKEVFLLDLTALVAGTQFRGQFESRMKGLVEEIRNHGNVILVIDEVHSLVGAGDAEGSMNAANILKPALSRGEIQVIGATTFNEYRKHIEKDAALERRFQPVIVAEPSINESIDIIMGIRHYYEAFHGVSISDEMARQAVILSERYITDRFLPDKAIDLIDEACSDMNLKSELIARKDAICKEKGDLQKERELILATPNGSDYARLAEIRSLDLRLANELEDLEQQGSPELTLDNLARVIELWTKIPASSIREDEFQRLSELDKRLKEHIIGQDDAVETVCAAIRRNRVGISAKRKPVSFIFLGSTGVGKTELVKRLAADLFDAPESLIRLDMSEFMEKHAVSRIIGSPPGYVGYDEAGQLTEKIRRKPYSVVLFDEIEKAHPDVFNILLQVLDDGRLTDNKGRTVNFKNTIIIMTSNIGSSLIRENFEKLDENNREEIIERTKTDVFELMKQTIRPEFLNRIDELIMFTPLNEQEIRQIVGLQLRGVEKMLAQNGIHLQITDSALEFITREGYDPQFGARPVKRVIQRYVLNELSKQIIAQKVEREKPIVIDYKNDELVFGN